MNLPLWRRRHPRNDDYALPVAQATCGHDTTRPWQSWEPLARMDIQTAVQIVSLSDYPLGPLELLTESHPVELPAYSGPDVGPVGEAVSAAVDTGERWARQAALAYKSSRAVMREMRIIKLLTWLSVGVGVGALLAAVQLIVYIYATTA